MISPVDHGKTEKRIRLAKMIDRGRRAEKCCRLPVVCPSVNRAVAVRGSRSGADIANVRKNQGLGSPPSNSILLKVNLLILHLLIIKLINIYM